MRTNFRWEDNYLVMTKGDTLSFAVEIFDQEDNPLNIDKASIVCKKNFTDVENVFAKSLGDGITKREDGVYIVRVSPEDTEDTECGKYFYSFRVELNGDLFTISKGVLEIQDVATDLLVGDDE